MSDSVEVICISCGVCYPEKDDSIMMWDGTALRHACDPQGDCEGFMLPVKELLRMERAHSAAMETLKKAAKAKARLEYRAEIEPEINHVVHSRCDDIGFENQMLSELMEILAVNIETDIEDILCGARPSQQES